MSNNNYRVSQVDVASWQTEYLDAEYGPASAILNHIIDKPKKVYTYTDDMVQTVPPSKLLHLFTEIKFEEILAVTKQNNIMHGAILFKLADEEKDWWCPKYLCSHLDVEAKSIHVNAQFLETEER